MRYKAFISYSHRDEAWARWLHRALESYRPPRALGELARLKPVFRDREELATSSSLSDTIVAALEDSEHLIVICSPAAAASKWVNEEIRSFRALGRNSVHCLLVEGDPATAFPPAILESAEPLAADPRRAADGRRNALLKLCAPLLGVSFDQLRQRDAAIRQRRLAAISVAAVLGMALTGALAALAFIGQQQAIAERARALEALEEAARAREEAERQARIASAINSFLNNDLLLAAAPDRLGRDVTVREVLERASGLVEERFPGEPLVQAEVRNSLGTTHLGLGEVEAAIAEFRLGLALRQEHAEPDSEILQNALSNLAAALSDVGEFDEAIELSEAAVASAKRADPDPMHLLALHEMAGYIYWDAKRFPEAEAHYSEALSLAEEHSEDTDDAFRAMNGLALIYAEDRRFDEAELMLRRLVGTLTEQLGTDHPDRVTVLGNLAVMLGQQASWEAAADVFEEIIEIDRRVYGDEHPKLAFDLQNYAAVLQNLDRVDEAEELLTEALAIVRLQPEEHTYLVNVLDTLGGIYRDLGRHDEAIAASAEALERSLVLYGESSTDVFRLANRHAGSLIAAGRYGEAEALLSRWSDRARTALPPDSIYLGLLLVSSGVAQGFLEQFGTGEPLLIEGIGYLEEGIGPAHDVTLSSIEDLIGFYERSGDSEQAARWQGVLESRRSS